MSSAPVTAAAPAAATSAADSERFILAVGNAIRSIDRSGQQIWQTECAVPVGSRSWNMTSFKETSQSVIVTVGPMVTILHKADGRIISQTNQAVKGGPPLFNNPVVGPLTK